MFCKLGIHKWSKWSDVALNKERQAFQHRWCLRCRKAEVKWLN